MSGLISTLIIFVALMVIGYVSVRMGVLSRSFAKDASSLTVNILICATILNSVIINPPQLSSGDMVRVMLLTGLAYLLFYVVARLFMPLIAPSKNTMAVVLLLMAVNNNMFIGVPVAEQTFGSAAVFYITLGCIPFNILLYTYGIMWLNKGENDSVGIRIRDMFSPPLVATLVALLLFLTRIQVPAIGVKFIGILANATMPISMLIIGASMSEVNLLESFMNPRMYLVSAVRLIVQPLVIWLVCRNLTSDTALLGALVIGAACPTGIMVTSLSLQYGKDAAFSSECILLDTALSMVTIPILLNILF